MEAKLIFEGPPMVPPVEDVVNTTNHAELCPFEFFDERKTVEVDSEWWNTEMTRESRGIVEELLNPSGFSVKEASKPIFRRPSVNPAAASTAKRPEFFHLYGAHLHMFDAHHWIHVVAEETGAKCFDLPPRFVRLLRDLGTIWCSGGGSNASIIEDIMDHPLWTKSIRPVLRALSPNGVGLFVKLSTTSGKNDRKIVPVKTERDLINYLTQSKLMLQQYQWFLEGWEKHPDVDPVRSNPDERPADIRVFPLKLLFQNWTDKISPSCEFRVFVYRNKVTAISQQSWSRQLEFATPVPVMAAAIVDLYTKSLTSRLPYHSAVLDVYFDADKGKATLIECNPWGAWNSSGSSLFRWIEDFDILYSSGEQIVVRTWS